MNEGSWARRTAPIVLGGLAAVALGVFVLPNVSMREQPRPVPPQGLNEASKPTPSVAASSLPPAATTGAPATPQATAPPVQAAPDPITTPSAPRFDVVRVGARGMAVVAGRAAPGAEVVLIADGGQEIGRARADARGEWVILPADPLPPGTRELSLRAVLAGEETAGPDTVVVLVPQPGSTPPVSTAEAPRPAAPALVVQGGTSGRPSAEASAEASGAGSRPSEAAPTGPVALLLPSAGGAAPRVLQGTSESAARPDQQASRLGLDVVDYDEGGAIHFQGTAPPGASVRVYVGRRHAGDAVADASGRWVLTPSELPPVGRNTLRVDQLASTGTVAARIEVPFQRDALPEAAFANHRVIVQPGHSLWRIAKQAYGEGVRYTTIYQANRDQIRDPDLIYPGQIFSLPEGQDALSDSSRSR